MYRVYINAQEDKELWKENLKNTYVRTTFNSIKSNNKFRTLYSKDFTPLQILCYFHL
jgi:hypothetical protein